MAKKKIKRAKKVEVTEDHWHKYSLALTLGVFLSVAHIAWLFLVAIGAAKPFMDWALALHHVQLSYSIMPFDIVNAVILVVMTFVVGYVAGWIISALWGGCCKRK